MIGSKISHYKILEKLGEGGMGEVYLAEDSKLKRKVALKFLSPHTVADEEDKTRFIYEAQASAALNHPNICVVYEIDEEKNQTFIAMEFIDGERLNEKIRSSPLSIVESVEIATQIAGGLKEASEKGIIHRDIKSSNILLTGNGKAKITDFGLAKLKGSKFVTKPGITIGTPSFMSPEQARGADVDLRTDIWSLGVVFYHMLTGELPFKGDADQAIIYSILNEEPVPFEEYKIDISIRLRKIIFKMLNKDPDKRYQNFDELICDLESSAMEVRITGNFQHRDHQPVRSNRKYLVLKLGIPILIVFSILLTFFVLPKMEKDKVNIKLIVLPFENLGSPDDDYFAEGVYMETLNRISAIHGLSIVPRLKAIQYSKAENLFESLRSDLDVGYLIEGRVSWNKTDSSSMIRIIIDFIDVENEILLWSEKYEGILKDIFSIQTDIAERVAKQLDIEILAPERKAIAEAPTDNMDAYELVIKAGSRSRYVQSLPRDERIREYLNDIEMLERAIELDSFYYNAYVNLSHKHSFLYFYGYDRSEERKNKTRLVLEKILELDRENPSARQQLAVYYYRMEGDYRKAYEILLDINKEYPNNAVLWLGIVERRLGMWEDAVEHLRMFEKLHPYDDDTPMILGNVYTFQRKYDLADKAFNRSLNNHPEFLYAVVEKSKNYILWNGNLQRACDVWNLLPDKGRTDLFWLFIHRLERNYKNILALLDSQKEKFAKMETCYFLKQTEYAQTYYLMRQPEDVKLYADSARVLLEEMKADNYGEPFFYNLIGLTYALLGDKDKALFYGMKAIELCPMQKDAYDGTIHLLNMAKIYSILEMKEKAIEQLEYLLSIPSEVSIAYLKLDPLWDNLRNSNRFKKLLEN